MTRWFGRTGLWPSARARIEAAEAEASRPIFISTSGDTGGGVGSLLVTSSRDAATLNTAPAGFIFSARLGPDWDVVDLATDIRCRWTFDDPGVYERFTSDLPWDRVYDVGGSIRIVRGWDVYAEDGLSYVETLPRTGGLAVPAGGTYLGLDRNIAYGPHAAHVFSAPGTYTVRCEALTRAMVVEHLANGGTIHDIEPVVATLDVAVTDPGDDFFGRRTLVVSGNSDWTGAPPMSLKFNSLADARKATFNRTDSDYRVLLRRGETFEPADANWKCRHLFWGAYGPETDARPVWTGSFKLEWDHAGTFTVQDIDFVGAYDVTDPARMVAANVKGLQTSGGQPHKCPTFHRVLLKGWAAYDPNRCTGTVFGDSLVRDWYSYGFQAEDVVEAFGCAGVEIKQATDTRNGGGRKTSDPPMYPDHGPIRFSRMVGPVIMTLCDAGGMAGWNTTEQDDGDIAYDVQPPWRLNVGGDDTGARIWFDRTRVVSGAWNTFPTNSRKTVHPLDYYVADKFYLSAHGRNGGAVGGQFGGVTFRNGIIVKDGVPHGPPSLPVQGTDNPPWADYFVYSTQPEINGPGNAEAPRRAYNLTCVDLRTMDGDAAASVTDWDGVTNFLEGNNVYVMPNWASPFDADQPLDDVSVMASHVDGYHFEDRPVDGAWRIEASALSLYYPEAGSAAIGDASPVPDADSSNDCIAIDDFFGRLRGLTPTRGAIEV
jgi:hypothetical protein